MDDDTNLIVGDLGKISRPMPCSTLSKEEYVILKGRPCQIVDITSSGSSIQLKGTDIFTQDEYEDSFSATDNVEVPFIYLTDYQVIQINDEGYLTLESESGELREDLKLPDGQLGQEWRSKCDSGVVCVVKKSCGEERVVEIYSK